MALLNKVKELNPMVRTMLVSAYEFQNNPNFEKYLELGIIDSFMEKPIKINMPKSKGFTYFVARIIRPTIKVAVIKINDKTVHLERSR